MKKSVVVGLMAMAVLSILAVSAFAFGGGMGRGGPEDREEIDTALESKDYQAYLNVVNASNTNGHGFVLAEDQFYELSAEYQEHKIFMDAHEEAELAIENKDYAAWSAAMNDLVALEQADIDQEHFDKIVNMHAQMNNQSFPETPLMRRGGFRR